MPRTFIGPLVISVLSAPTVMFFNVAGLHKFWTQYVGERIIVRKKVLVGNKRAAKLHFYRKSKLLTNYRGE